MIKRSIGVVIPTVALMFALIGCGTATDQQAGVEPNAVPGETPYAGLPASPYPILSYEVIRAKRASRPSSSPFSIA